jgi:hypothetical protein
LARRAASRDIDLAGRKGAAAELIEEATANHRAKSMGWLIYVNSKYQKRFPYSPESTGIGLFAPFLALSRKRAVIELI